MPWPPLSASRAPATRAYVRAPLAPAAENRSVLCCCIMLPLALLRERHSSRPDGLTAPFGVVRVEQTTTAAAAPPAASCGRTRLRPAEALSSSGSGFAASAPASFRERRPCRAAAHDKTHLGSGCWAGGDQVRRHTGDSLLSSHAGKRTAGTIILSAADCLASQLAAQRRTAPCECWHPAASVAQSLLHRS